MGATNQGNPSIAGVSRLAQADLVFPAAGNDLVVLSMALGGASKLSVTLTRIGIFSPAPGQIRASLFTSLVDVTKYANPFDGLDQLIDSFTLTSEVETFYTVARTAPIPTLVLGYPFVAEYEGISGAFFTVVLTSSEPVVAGPETAFRIGMRGSA